ncbi:hypothetical protein VPH35_049213 [Triticum aestivum]
MSGATKGIGCCPFFSRGATPRGWSLHTRRRDSPNTVTACGDERAATSARCHGCPQLVALLSMTIATRFLLPPCCFLLEPTHVFATTHSPQICYHGDFLLEPANHFATTVLGFVTTGVL